VSKKPAAFKGELKNLPDDVELAVNQLSPEI
jgi:hypothetical protein